MKTTTVNFTGQLIFQYDENSPEFKQAFIDFKQVIDSGATSTDDMISHIAYNVARQAVEQLVEGVGYVKYNGRVEDEEMYCGVELLDEGYDNMFGQVELESEIE